MKQIAASVVLVLCLSACSEDTSSMPTAPTAPSPPTPAPQTWTLNGRVIGTQSQQAIPGVHLSGFEVTTNGAGLFTATGQGTRSTTRVALDAPGFMSRQTTIRNTTDNPTIDLISLSGFSLDFYRQLVRNGFEAPTRLEPIRRWTTNPNFYINTLKPDGTPVDATESLAIVRTWLVNGVPLWTGGRLSAGTIETGAGDRAAAAGWIRVDFKLTDPAFCGRALVGSNPGNITLHNDHCACGSIKINPATVLHELGHALGFWHVGDRNSVMFHQIPGACPAPILSANERDSSAIAFQRLTGNTDPDTDPIGTGFLAPPQWVTN